MRLATILVACFALQLAHADTLTIAVASNFRATAEIIAAEFTEETGHDVRISSGSTGKLHAQLVHGAPYDVLLAANEESPRMIEASGAGVSGTRFTYAVGTLVLWSSADRIANREVNRVADCAEELQSLGSFRLAIANPETAPYGRAAKEFLMAANLWTSVSSQLVYGENVAQALHFAVTGNARYALVANSQAIDPRLPAATCAWPVPTDLYAPIEQQAILLQRAADDPVARSFLQYLQSARVRDRIQKSGYGVP